MTIRQGAVAEQVRIGAEEVKARLLAGVPITMLDARNDKAWETSPVTIHGAVRVRPADWHIDPSWPKGQLTVVY